MKRKFQALPTHCNPLALHQVELVVMCMSYLVLSCLVLLSCCHVLSCLVLFCCLVVMSCLVILFCTPVVIQSCAQIEIRGLPRRPAVA